MTNDHEAKTAAMTSGMLRKRLWVVLTKSIVDRAAMAPFMEAHLAHQVRLEKEGIMFGAGPLANPDGAKAGLGLIIIRAASVEEARRIADSDPMHANGLRTYTLYEWTLNEGRITLSFDFSDQTVRYD